MRALGFKHKDIDSGFIIVKKFGMEQLFGEQKLADYVEEGLKKIGISISKPMLAIVCIISGVMVILLPTLLVWIVGLFLVVQGALLLTDYYEQMRRTTVPRPKSVYCRNCRARNTEESVYCRRCGEKLVQTERMVTAQPQEAVQ